MVALVSEVEAWPTLEPPWPNVRVDKPKEEAPYLETSPVVEPSTVVAGAVRESTVEPPRRRAVSAR